MILMEIKKGIMVSEILEIEADAWNVWREKQFCSCTKGASGTSISVSSDSFLIQEKCKNEEN